MQAMCAVELRSTVMDLWCDTPAGRKALERDGGYMRAEALVLNGPSLPPVPQHTVPFTLNTQRQNGGRKRETRLLLRHRQLCKYGATLFNAAFTSAIALDGILQSYRVLSRSRCIWICNEQRLKRMDSSFNSMNAFAYSIDLSLINF
jgi:hypothetical protein